MATNAGRGNARRAALARMAELGWNPATLGEGAGIDYGTAGDFLNGKRWPKVATLGKIDAAFGWAPGTLAAIGEELQQAPVGQRRDGDDQILFRRPEGLTEQEWQDMKSRMTGGWEWELRQADRER